MYRMHNCENPRSNPITAMEAQEAQRVNKSIIEPPKPITKKKVTYTIRFVVLNVGEAG
jgi:hypothetical protein